ncbi:MAG: hypothetical protein JSS13_01475 [Proteobacteria bacterium]|nr:hypothetical protein [Pseudomonadota bacterium]
MSHYKPSQSLLLYFAVAVLAAGIAISYFRSDSPQSNAPVTGKQAAVHPTQKLPAAEPQSSALAQASRDIDNRGNSMNKPSESARAAESNSSEIERASAAFHQSHECHVAWNTIKGLRAEIAACDSLGSAMDDTCRRNIKRAEEQIQSQTARLTNCSAVPAVLEKAYFDSVGRAAELGNADAQVCYVQGNFSIEISDQQMERYKDNARNFIQLGLERGDWRIVNLLAQDTNVHISGFLGSVSSRSPIDILRMNRLLRHGATGGYAQFLDTNAKDLAIRLGNKAQVDSANSWAQEEYERHFHNSPILNSEPEDCKEAELHEETPGQ